MINAVNEVVLNEMSSIVTGVGIIGNEVEGNAGTLKIHTGKLSLIDKSLVESQTLGDGNAGEVTIKANESIILDSGSNINSDVQEGGIGSAGNLELTSPLLRLQDKANLSASTLAAGEGNSGNISIKVDRVEIFDNAFIQAGTENKAAGGNISLDVKTLELSNNGEIRALTSGLGNAGNINLLISEDIRLTQDSLISAKAFRNADGGNVTIDASDGFILAFPNGNSDIIASSVEGDGGNINIKTQALFGIEERLSTPPNITNDIDASSDFGLQGDFSLNTPDFDPTSGLLELPEAVGNASDQISQNPCEQGVGSEFLVTGKGGLPANPQETLNSDRVKVGLIESVSSQQQARGSNNTNSESSTSEPVPVQGWIFNEKGKVIFTAYATEDTPTKRSEKNHHSTCSSGT